LEELPDWFEEEPLDCLEEESPECSFLLEFDELDILFLF
jgi:hypothetical protein